MLVAYKSPVPKIAYTGSFLLIDICKCHIAHSGKSNVAVSDTKLMIPHENVAAIESMQTAFMPRFQMASRGQHWKVNDRVEAR